MEVHRRQLSSPLGGLHFRFRFRRGNPKGVGLCPFFYIGGFPGGQWAEFLLLEKPHPHKIGFVGGKAVVPLPPALQG